MTPEQVNAAGFNVDDETHARLAAYVSHLLATNRELNLTAVEDPGEFWRAHVCDSLALLDCVPVAASLRVLDLGTGGGLPGIPFACARPAAAVTLLDATRKKAEAVERLAAAAGLANVRGVWGRAETLAHDAEHREQYDVVTARAVATLPVLVEYAAGFVKPGGHCWFFKSAGAATSEGASAESAAAACKLCYAAQHVYRLPEDDRDRVLVGYRKDGPLDATLPRRPGRAKKRPL